jgi:cyclic pyranopterin monophosphate synthase
VKKMSEMAIKEFSHIDKQNKPCMVDVSDKLITKRTATAQGCIYLPPELQQAFEDGDIKSKKGPVIQTAIIAGTAAVKQTPLLIPFCHTLPLEAIKFDFNIVDELLYINCSVTVTAKTGVEMEALTGVSLAALTVYDMCKALSHNIIIREIKLVTKTGGKSDYQEAE